MFMVLHGCSVQAEGMELTALLSLFLCCAAVYMDPSCYWWTCPPDCLSGSILAFCATLVCDMNILKCRRGMIISPPYINLFYHTCSLISQSCTLVTQCYMILSSTRENNKHSYIDSYVTCNKHCRDSWSSHISQWLTIYHSKFVQGSFEHITMEVPWHCVLHTLAVSQRIHVSWRTVVRHM